ncbi:TetR/AcrR family transcriptional regulator [Saccharomonospora piscinae]|uniref:TetR/AcrR family transcriptional regulator n=1 Tax=Saccharomonospora piscinae TaxID=687388 RepID=UPI000467339B|nr:TetR/AcrR family transcriptional regulator [Saccharomonospora piscinae]
MPGRDTYHHGDLRRAIITVAVDVISTDGTAAISLRDLARRAGVSHAAPAHHFGDKAGLLTAIAVEGYEFLADSLQDALNSTPLPLVELGVRYVNFAAEHPAHFEVMYRPDLYHRDDPELLAAKNWTRRVLRAGVAGAPSDAHDTIVEADALAAWSMAHGFATLLRTGNFEEFLDDTTPIELFRRLARRAAPFRDLADDRPTT